MTHMSTPRSTCRSCSSYLLPLLDLGSIVPSDFLRPDEKDPERLPLALTMCEACDLVQLQHTTDPESLYRKYWYLSGVNETMVEELRDIVRTVRTYVRLNSADVVVDVGANDGTLLQGYEDIGQVQSLPVRVAFEPALNLFTNLRPHCTVLHPTFFPSEISASMQAGSVKALTSIAMFYDLDDPRAFVAEVDRILTEDGVWIVQFQDLAQMVQANAYDNIGHEHLCYYSLQSFEALLVGFDLRVLAVATRAINGGSLRLVVGRHNDRVEQPSVSQHRRREAWCTPIMLERFAIQIAHHRDSLQDTLLQLKDQPIDLYAASTKSSTLLQYCGIDHRMIRQAAERSPAKWGRVTSGTRIPCVPEGEWRADPAPVTLIGAWQFADHFAEREAEYLEKGGSFLVPLPTPRVIRGA